MGHQKVSRNATAVLKIDLSDESTTLLGSFPSGGSKFSGATLAPNGFVYALPIGASQTSILKINPSDDSIATFGDLSGIATPRFYGGVLAPNGKIYTTPAAAQETVKLDTGSTPFDVDVTLSLFLNKF